MKRATEIYLPVKRLITGKLDVPDSFLWKQKPLSDHSCSRRNLVSLILNLRIWTLEFQD
jgi:hypothetical protein